MEVTQAIQNLTNSVLLIKNKRTFVRVYVKSAGPSVAGVTATLSAPSFGGTPLQPVNPVGTKLTVRTNPNRNDINQSFLFELPWSWTSNGNLNLHADLNPYKVPLEPNYADNTSSLTVNFQNSPTLSVEFFRLNYTSERHHLPPALRGRRAAHLFLDPARLPHRRGGRAELQAAPVGRGRRHAAGRAG